ncbi:MAG: CpaE family protein, partial [Planctomycetaceae bacterium]
RSQPGRFITVCGSSGGSGRTFLATNLAVALSRTQSRACLLDLDLQGGDAAASLNLKPRYSVCDLCQNIEQLDQKMFEQSLLEHSTSLSVLASPERWFDGERLSAEGLQKLLRLSRASFTDIVIDLNCFWQHEYTELLQQSSAVLFVLRQDFAAVRNARRALVQLERMGVDKSHIHIVANFHGQPKEIDEAKVESALDAKIRHRLPWDPKTVNLCVNCGTPVVLEAPGSQLANAIVNIAYVLDGREPGTHGAASSLEASWQQSVTRIRTLLEDKARLWRTALPAQFRPHNS